MRKESRDKQLLSKETYDQEIERAKAARNTQKNDSNPMVEYDGFLGIDALDRMRRRKLK